MKFYNLLRPLLNQTSARVFSSKSFPLPWDINKSFLNTKKHIESLQPLERDIFKRLWTAHRSLGSDNPIAHATVCAASNMARLALDGRPLPQFQHLKNPLEGPLTGLGEGGTFPDRYPTQENAILGSSWVQYAQGRFGLRNELLRSADLITIKIAHIPSLIDI